MSETSTPTPPATNQSPSVPAPVPQPRRGMWRWGGCLGRFASALLVIIITTAITLGAVGYAALALGFTPQTAGALSEAQARVATLETENSALKAEQVEVQTQLADMIRQSGNDREEVDGLREQVTAFAAIGAEVATRIAADTRERATLVADINTSRAAVQLYATAEAGRVEQLEELRRRSERIDRFLFRLSDIANDAAQDLSNETPTPAAILTDTPTPSPAVPSSTLTLVPPSPTSVPATATTAPANATPTPAANPTAAARTATASPRATITPSLTPTPQP